MKYYILFGPPGAGKGTQAKLMVQKYNLLHVSTGDLLRKEMAAETELGKKVKLLIDNGDFVPDEYVTGMIENEIKNHPHVKGFILDGFPRTTKQAEILDILLNKLGHQVNLVISISIGDDIVKERIRHRAKLENRLDDTRDEIIEHRIKTYHEKTEPIIKYYKARNKYNEINGVGSIEDIFSKISDLIGE